MGDLPKRVRRQECEWPSAEETDRQIAEVLYSGKPPFKEWKPSSDLNQAIQVAQEYAAAREWNFELTYRALIWDQPVNDWEGRFSCLNTEAVKIRDYRHSVEGYWATGKTPAMAVCRAILNVLDGITEGEYR